LEKTGHKLTLSDFDSIAHIDSLAEEVVNGAPTNVDLLSLPFFIDGVAFYPSTMAKELYWREQLYPNLADKHKTAAFLWLMSKPDIPKEPLTKKIMRKIRRYESSCRLTEYQIKRIIDTYSNGSERKEVDAEAIEYGPVVALLVREYGESVTYWLNCPVDLIKTLIADWTARQEAQAAAMRRSSASKGAPIPPAPSPKIKSLQRFRKAITALREAWENDT